MKIKALILWTFLALPMAATADNCDQGNLTGFDSVYCFSKVYLGEDARLNDNSARCAACCHPASATPCATHSAAGSLIATAPA